MCSRLVLTVFLVAALVALGAALPQQPQQPPGRPGQPGRPAQPGQPGRQGGNQPGGNQPGGPPGTLPGSTPAPTPGSGGPVNPSPSLTPSQLVDAQGAPVNCPCQATQEYNPVCGSNGATYNNPSKLRCAQRCGYEVELTFYGQCPAQRS